MGDERYEKILKEIEFRNKMVRDYMEQLRIRLEEIGKKQEENKKKNQF